MGTEFFIFFFFVFLIELEFFSDEKSTRECYQVIALANGRRNRLHFGFFFSLSFC